MNLVDKRYGYRVIGGKYQPIYEEQAVIGRIGELHDAGAGWDEVAQQLNALKDVEPPSGTLWKAEIVRRIYAREFGGTYDPL